MQFKTEALLKNIPLPRKMKIKIDYFFLGGTSCDRFLEKDMSHNSALWLNLKIPISSTLAGWAITVGLDKPFTAFTSLEGLDMACDFKRTRCYLSNGV